MLLSLLSGLLVAGCSSRGSSADDVARLLRGSLPAEWVLSSSVDPGRFKPLRGLPHPLAQLTLANQSDTLTWVLSPEKWKILHPTLTLLLFPISDLQEVEEAVRQQGYRSDFPPVIFGLIDEYILVTSPGYVNEGLHTPEAEATIQELKDALKRTVQIR